MLPGEPSLTLTQRTSATITHLAAADALLGIDPSLIRLWRRRVEPVAEGPGRSEESERSPHPDRPSGPASEPIERSAAAGFATMPIMPIREGTLRSSLTEREPTARPADGRRGANVAPSDALERAARLEALRAEHDTSCPHCTTATGHTRTVFGEGSPVAELLFVGEAPGETEDRLGRPFVGRAGEKLDQIITAMGLSRGDVYIANVLKSRPPGNRTPLRHEIDGCGPYLGRQIEIIQPQAIVTLGGPATQLLLGVTVGITRLRGIWASYAVSDRTIPVMPTFHPAYLLRNYTPETRRQVWEDMQKVLELLVTAR